MKSVVGREFEVAFSKHAQPLWLRITKYIVLAVLVCFLRNSKWLWPILTGISVLALALHFWYRYKTKGWTKSYGGWDYNKNQSKY